MDFLEKVYSKIEENKTEMVSSLSKIISVPSVALSSEEGRPEEGKPFGEEVDRVYRMMMAMGRKEGFDTFDADGYGGHIDYDGTADGIAGIVGHLDVVPAGDNWDFEPYSGDVADGYVLGRGATDDKGPVIASFYAMKALKDCGFEPDRTVRLILGLDEETNWEGMKYYLGKVGDYPDCGFTPDGDFPVIRGEMGILVFDILKKFPSSKGKGLELSSIRGGTAANAVADFARAVVSDTSGGGYEEIKKMIAECRREKGWKINCKGIGKSLEITVGGKAAHGARPEKGINAVSIMMEFLGNLNFLNDGVADFINFYNSRIGYNLHGENIGCPFEDEDSGKLIFNVGKIDVNKGTGRITVNIRYPISLNEDTVYEGIMSVLDLYNSGIVKIKQQDPINLSEDTEFIRTLMDIYSRHTGDTESRPMVIGGGTYARAMKNIVAFGGRFPSEPELAHQRNEKISIENLIKLTRIYAEAIYRLAEV